MTTLIAPHHFSPIEDAQNIKKACKGLGTDEKAIISILGHRNAAQRKLIRLAYDELYQQDLIQQLKSELSGDFEKAITLWTLEPADRDAIIANTALKRSEPDYSEIIEMACIRSPEELLEVKRAYRLRYKHSLEEDVACHTTGDIRRLLVAIISSYKYDGDELDEKLSHLEANIVYDEIHSNTSVHEELIRILSTRSKAQLCSTFNAYKDIYHSSITKALSRDPADAYLAALRAAIRCTKNPQRYFVKVLRNAIKDPGTDEDALSRVITTRAESDLKDISKLFMKRSNMPLEDAVTKSTSGDYKDFLLALLCRE